MLRSLDDKVGDGYRVLLADSAKIAMRGLDYRSYNGSIMLVIMNSF